MESQSSPQTAKAALAAAAEPSQNASSSTHAAGNETEAVKPKRANSAKAKLKLEVAHQVPGRIRMKISSAKGNPELLKEIAETFGVIPGIERVSVNATTGSIVLHYDTERHEEFHDRLRPHYLGSASPAYAPPRTEIDALAFTIAQEAEFLAQHSHSAKLIIDVFKKYDREIRHATGNAVDLKVGLAIGLIAVTVFELGASAATPIWLTFTVFGLNHIIEMNQPRQQMAPAVAPVVFKTR